MDSEGNRETRGDTQVFSWGNYLEDGKQVWNAEEEARVGGEITKAILDGLGPSDGGKYAKVRRTMWPVKSGRVYPAGIRLWGHRCHPCMKIEWNEITAPLRPRGAGGVSASGAKIL